jgi:hypothetical protein
MGTMKTTPDRLTNKQTNDDDEEDDDDEGTMRA